MTNAGKLRIFPGQLQQLVASSHQRVMPGTRVILKLHIKPG